MSKRNLLRRLDRLLDSLDQRIGRAVIAKEPITRRLSELELLREVRAALALKPQTVKSGPKAPITLGQQPRVDRELQASEARIVAHIEACPDHCFALSDLLNDLEMPEKTLKNGLTCLVRDGFIVRPRRGFYGPRRS